MVTAVDRYRQSGSRLSTRPHPRITGNWLDEWKLALFPKSGIILAWLVHIAAAESPGIRDLSSASSSVTRCDKLETIPKVVKLL